MSRVRGRIKDRGKRHSPNRVNLLIRTPHTEDVLYLLWNIEWGQLGHPNNIALKFIPRARDVIVSFLILEPSPGWTDVRSDRTECLEFGAVGDGAEDRSGDDELL